MTIQKISSTVFFLFMIISNQEIFGQEVILKSTDGKVSPCSIDLRAGDFFIINGIVNITNGRLGSNFITFQMKTKFDNDFKDLCSASILSCSTPNSIACYCAVDNGNDFEIVANRSAIVNYTNADIRIMWKESSGRNITSNSLKLPNIYDANNATTILTVDDVVKTCPLTVPNGSVFKYKCLDSARPCNVIIAVNNTVKENGEHNATYTVTNLTLKATYTFTYSYSVCGGSNQSEYCLVTIEDDITTVSTSTHVVTNGTTTMTTGTTVTLSTVNSSTGHHGTALPICSLSCQAWAIALSVIYYIAIIVIMFTGITILYLSNKSKKRTPLYYLCIGFLVFAEVLDIILIIVFAQASPCQCDPETDIDLAIWEIMLIIFCIVNGLLSIAALVTLFCLDSGCVNNTSTITNTTNTGTPNTTPITGTTTTTTSITATPITATTNTTSSTAPPSTRTPTIGRNDKKQSDHKANGKNGNDQNDQHENYDMPEINHAHEAESNYDPVIDGEEVKTGEFSQVRQSQKRKSSTRKKALKDQEEESSPPNRQLPKPNKKESDKNFDSVHPNKQNGTELPNPYNSKK